MEYYVSEDAENFPFNIETALFGRAFPGIHTHTLTHGITHGITHARARARGISRLRRLVCGRKVCLVPPSAPRCLVPAPHTPPPRTCLPAGGGR